MTEEQQQIIMFMDHYATSELLAHEPSAFELAMSACEAYHLWPDQDSNKPRYFISNTAFPLWVWYAAQMVVAIREEGQYDQVAS